MLYMLLICFDPTAPAPRDEPSLQPEHAKLERELRASGQYVSGAALWPAGIGRRIGVGRGVTDGPFAETKEALGGYYIVETTDEAEALAIGARVPVGRGWIEVRRIALFHPDAERIAAMGTA